MAPCAYVGCRKLDVTRVMPSVATVYLGCESNTRLKQWAAITAALGGQMAAILAWLVSTHIIYGAIDCKLYAYAL